MLQGGPHTEAKSFVLSTNNSSIARFTFKKETCMSCKCILTNSDKATVCLHCKPVESRIYQNLICEHSNLEYRFNRLWTQCQRCQGSLHEEVLCTNKDCTIFYMRKSAQKNLQLCSKRLERFGECDW